MLLSPYESPEPRQQSPLWKTRLRKIMNHPTTDLLVMGMILLSIVLIVLEVALSKDWIFLERLNFAITLFFVFELTLRLMAERSLSLFFRRYWIDIIATAAPYFRFLRVLRVLRLLRIFRLGQLLNRRFSGIQSWLTYSIGHHLWLLFLVFTLVLAGSITFHFIEPNNPQVKTYWDALWWSAFTLVSGEPLTGEPARTFSGRLISLVIIIAGMVTFAALTGIITAIMVNRLKPQMERGDMDLEELEGHLVICGWSRSANLLIAALQNSEEYKDKGIVLIAEFDENEPENLLDKTKIFPSTLYVVKGDFTRLEILDRAGIKRASEVIILADQIGDRADQDRDARTVLAALLIERQNPEVFTSVELLNRDNAAHLHSIGVEEILITDEYTGTILANAQRTRGIITLLNELFDPTRGNQFYKIELPDSWLDKNIREIFQTLKQDYNAILVSLETADENGQCQLQVNPAGDIRPKANDKIVVIASKQLKLS